LVVKGYVKDKMRERHYGQVAREVVLMQKCRPAGIVRFAGSFEDDRVIYIVQEDCSKGDLFQLMNACGGRMAEKDVARKVVAPLLQSLEVLHTLNVLHRDIKPENIFFAADGSMRLGDFGLAICTATERPKSRVGTLDYMVRVFPWVFLFFGLTRLFPPGLRATSPTPHPPRQPPPLPLSSSPLHCPLFAKSCNTDLPSL
jgi:serine/threonine protein kinase